MALKFMPIQTKNVLMWPSMKSSSKEYVHTPRVGKCLVDSSNSGHTRGPKRCSSNLVLKQACSLALHVQRKCWQKLLV